MAKKLDKKAQKLNRKANEAQENERGNEAARRRNRQSFILKFEKYMADHYKANPHDQPARMFQLEGVTYR